MLQVGCKHGPGGKNDPGLSIEETRTHFGAWAIVSSPLTLSHDVNDDTISDMIWPIIANKEALEVNQAYSGHSGSQFKASDTMITLEQDAVHKLTNEFVLIAVPTDLFTLSWLRVISLCSRDRFCRVG